MKHYSTDITKCKYCGLETSPNDKNIDICNDCLSEIANEFLAEGDYDDERM